MSLETPQYLVDRFQGYVGRSTRTRHSCSISLTTATVDRTSVTVQASRGSHRTVDCVIAAEQHGRIFHVSLRFRLDDVQQGCLQCRVRPISSRKSIAGSALVPRRKLRLEPRNIAVTASANNTGDTRLRTQYSGVNSEGSISRPVTLDSIVVLETVSLFPASTSEIECRYDCATSSM